MFPDRIDTAFACFQRSGSPHELAVVFDATAAGLLHVARHLVGDPHAAEDVLQATFVAAIEHAARYDASRSVAAWLHGILANQARRHRERTQRAPDPGRLPPPLQAEPAASAQGRELSRAVDAAIGRLPAAYRPVLRLHLDHGMAAPEIALALGRAPGTVRKQIARGLQRLRGLLPAGLASLVAGWLLPARGLAQIRAEVLGAAARAAALPAGAVAVPLGVLAMNMQKTLVLLSGLLAIAFVWLVWPPAGGEVEGDRAAAAGRAVAAFDPGPVPDAVGGTGAVAGEEERTRNALAAAQGAGALLVRVRWADGAPAADVTVRLWPMELAERTARTDAAGEARFGDLEPGTVPVALDRGLATRRIAVRSCELQVVEVEIPGGIDLRGVVRAEGGAPIAGARIWLSDGFSQSHGCVVARSDGEGRFAVRAVGARQLVSAAADGYLACELVQVGSGEVELVLTGPAGAVQGIVCDDYGQPLPGAAVMAGMVSLDAGTYLGSRLYLGTPPLYLRADATGRFAITGLRIGRPTPIWACAAGYALGRVDATAGQTEPVVLRLGRGAIVEGIVRDGNGTALPGATVQQRGSDGLQGPYWWCWPAAVTGADGSFRLEHLVPGARSLEAAKGGHLPDAMSLEVAHGTRAVWHPVLHRAAAIRGRVMAPDGRPLGGMQVDAHAPDHGGHSLSMVATDADGGFELTGCKAQRYTVRVFEAANWGRFSVAVARDVPADGELRIEVADEHRGTASLAARLVREDGTPVAHADVWVWREPFEGGPRRTTDAQGRLLADHLPPSRYRLEARIADHPSLELGIFAVGPGEQRDLGEITVPTPGAIEVQVLRADGSRVEHDWIHVLRDGRMVEGFPLADGSGRSPPLVPGGCTLRLWGEEVPFI